MAERQTDIVMFVEVNDPAVGTESDGVTDGEVDAAVPVNDDEQVDHDLGDAEGVGQTGVRLRFVEKGQQSRQTQQTIEAGDDGTRGVGTDDGSVPHEVEQIGRQQTQQIQFEAEAVQVVLPQFGRVGDQKPLFQVAFVGVNHAVQDVNQIAQVIEHHPDIRTGVLHVPKHGSADDQEVIVHDGQTDDPQPLNGNKRQSRELLLELNFHENDSSYSIMSSFGSVDDQSASAMSGTKEGSDSRLQMRFLLISGYEAFQECSR